MPNLRKIETDIETELRLNFGNAVKVPSNRSKEWFNKEMKCKHRYYKLIQLRRYTARATKLLQKMSWYLADSEKAIKERNLWDWTASKQDLNRLRKTANFPPREKKLGATLARLHNWNFSWPAKAKGMESIDIKASLKFNCSLSDSDAEVLFWVKIYYNFHYIVSRLFLHKYALIN